MNDNLAELDVRFRITLSCRAQNFPRLLNFVAGAMNGKVNAESRQAYLARTQKETNANTLYASSEQALSFQRSIRKVFHRNFPKNESMKGLECSAPCNSKIV